MPRKTKPTPGEACDLHLRDLRRAHGRPPADVPLEPNDRPPQILPRLRAPGRLLECDRLALMLCRADRRPPRGRSA